MNIETKEMEEVLRKRTRDLGERVKELNCLYGIFELLEERPGISLAEILQGTVDLLPPSWQYPEITCARIILDDQEFKTKNFRETVWRQASNIIVHGKQTGIVEVCYTEEKEAMDEGPFLKEERSLINAIAERLGRIAERKRVEERIEHLNAVLRAISKVNQLIIKERDRDRLLQGACHSLIETRGYYNAWIALLDKSGGLVTTTEAGLGKDFQPMIEQLKRSELTDCGRRALTQSGVVVTKDPSSTCADCPLSSMYSGRGALTVGLEYGGRVYGLFSASIPTNLTLDEEEQALFKEVAGDIALAIYNIELEKDRERADEALRESEEKYRSLVESTEDSIYLVDRNCRYLFMNKKHLSRFGLPIDKVIGRTYGEFHSEEETKGFEEKVREAFETSRSLWYEYRSQRDGGYFLRTLGPVKQPDGRPIAVTVVSKNITERKRAEEVLKQATALETLTTVLQNFIGDSLGNLLFVVCGQLGMCEFSDSIDQVRSNINGATQGLNELIQGTQAYQTFSSLREGSLGDINSVAVSSILEPLLSGQPLQTYQKKRFPINPNVKLRFVCDPKQEGALSWEELPSVLGSKLAIATAVQETLINAVESYDQEKGGGVVVSAKKEDHSLTLEIADKGRGMSDEDRDKSQLPFFKILGIKESARLGLGAYIARQSAKYCGGDIHIDSTEGVGTTASILFAVTDQVS